MQDISGLGLCNYDRGAEGAEIVNELDDQKQVDIDVHVLGHALDLLVVVGEGRNPDEVEHSLEDPPNWSGDIVGVKGHGFFSLHFIVNNNFFESFLWLSVQVNFVNVQAISILADILRVH